MSARRSAVVAAAALALSSTVTVAPAYAIDTYAKVQAGELTYKAAPGQVNQVVFTKLDASAYLVDDIVAITPLDGCTHPDAADLTLVRCTATMTLSGQLIIDVNDLDDTVNHTGPNPALVGLGAGDDIAYGYPGSTGSLVSGGPGNDLIYSGPGKHTVEGGNGDDFVSGVMGNDSVSGGPGNDEVFGDWGDDTLNGDAGTDTVYGGPGANTEYGGGGNDTLYGGNTADYLNGGTGNDTVEAGAGNDTLLGSWGNDHLDGGTGAADDCDGGPGIDTQTGCEL